MKKITPIFIAACQVLGTTAFASDCPNFGVEQKQQIHFCSEFLELLYAPYEPDQNRETGRDQSEAVEDVINSDSLWGEIYRADPAKTLDLIKRIKDAGGLKKN